ncbi:MULTISPECIES: LapA family protein [Silvimonas]|uniref:LapA family protein n=1 Tax=Silvimonas TaxID=300264 RepID=UPI0024B3664F|nr:MULTISPECIES: LapA family protein [Silvimonas]MDR3429078.1 LapA family protein [Silvimonas sp.]
MRYVYGLLKLIVFVVLLGFAMRNGASTSLRFFAGYEWTAPLSMILLVFFVVGVALGLLASFTRVVRMRRELVSLRKELRVRAAAPVATAEAVAVEPPRDAF